MSSYLKNRPHLWRRNLMKLILTVGLLMILAVSETEAQTGHPMTKELAASTAPETITPAQVERFCNQTHKRTFYTECDVCYLIYEMCPTGSVYVDLEGCTEDWYCQAICMEEYITKSCCHGFWGEGCVQECPGGSGNPCNGHGKCSQNDGQCVCEPGFEGTACELCTNMTKYGPNCSLDCICEDGECNNGIHGDGLCTGDNPCQSPVSPCGNNSRCIQTGAGRHRCDCHDGYAGDGTECAPINPCQNNSAGCHVTTHCIYTGPNQHKCQCKEGYEGDNPDKGCTIKDMCRPGICGPNAVCETREPLKHSCVCNEGYLWNGKVCMRNIIERLKELNTEDPHFKNQLQYMVNITARFYGDILARPEPITIFVPTDQAFRSVMNGTQLANLLGDDNKLHQILRQHIAAGHFMTNSSSSFYNLQGNQANFTTGDIVFCMLSYGNCTTRDPAKIIEGNLEAWNGIIHIINTVIGMNETVFGDTKQTVLELIKNQTDYSRMYSMITAAGLSELFSQPNTTVLITDNKAWNSSHLQAKNYLMYDVEGRIKLEAILKNHVFPGVIGVTDLMGTHNMKSAANVNVKVKISKKGQIQLDANFTITKANIPVKTGLCHHLDKVMVPSYLLPLVNSTREVNATVEVKGHCTKCGLKGICPLPTDMPLEYGGTCIKFHFHPPDLGETNFAISQLSGEVYIPRQSPIIEIADCYKMCQRKVKKQGCSEGFYGRSCNPCPGGYRNPCSGHGNCSDGDSGRGHCSCTENFFGTICDQCARNDTFGPHCNETCTCQFGQCDTGTRGTGRCKPETCQLGYTGENCDKKLGPCEYDCYDSNSTCFQGEDGIESCYCLPGYKITEDNCLEIDLCEEGRNPCHQQATCSHKGPGAINCSCNNGWHGDGFHCMPNHPCDDDTHCHKSAVCTDLEPGQYRCECKTGYIGNGDNCKLVDLCLEYNGGCHYKAQCTFTQGERHCTCPEFMVGDGITCKGTIAAEIMGHRDLSYLSILMKRFPQNENNSRNMLDSMNGIYTFFAPSDSALESYLRKLDNFEYWREEENVLSFLKFHTLRYVYPTEDLMALDGVIESYPTLFDGFSLRIVKVNSSLHIVSSRSNFAVITKANIIALNGYFHIIDQVLEPFLPDGHELPLGNFLPSQPQYHLFYEALRKTNLLENVSSLHEYTLFVLPNDVLQQITRNITADFLKFYVVPNRILTASMSGDVNTLLGPDHRLYFNVSATQVLVNNMKITRPDILTDVGVIHELAGALHPVLSRCDVITQEVRLGPCGDCTPDGNLTCPKGFTPRSIMHFELSSCRHRNFGNMYMEAAATCKLICEKTTHIPKCCSGYYGPNCDECPGGAETPCSGNGFCQDGKEGSGRCSCRFSFTGKLCERCEHPDLVPPFCNAIKQYCNVYNEKKVCHPQAECALNAHQCRCKSGFHGNGTWCKQNSQPCDSDNGGCDLERATCGFTKPRVTDMAEGVTVCKCKSGYVGDGKLCSTDLLDAISRIPELKSFHSWLLSTGANIKTNITELFGDRSTNRTVFVSINKPINASSFTIVNGIFTLPNHPGTEDEVSTTISNRSPGKYYTRQWTLISLSGQVNNVTLNGQGKYFFNGAEVVQRNIWTLNGILHLTADSQVNSDNTIAAETVSHLVIIGVTVIVIAVLMALLTIVIYKKRHHLLSSFLHRSTGEHSSISFTRIKSQDSQSSPNGTQYENTLFID